MSMPIGLQTTGTTLDADIFEKLPAMVGGDKEHACGQEKYGKSGAACTLPAGHFSDHAWIVDNETATAYTVAETWPYNPSGVIRVKESDIAKVGECGELTTLANSIAISGLGTFEAGQEVGCSLPKGHPGRHLACVRGLEGGDDLQLVVIETFNNQQDPWEFPSGEVEVEVEENPEPEARKEYPMPNGGVYLARKLPPFPDDVLGLRELCKYDAEGGFRKQKHVLLVGEPGTGKTALVQAAFPDSVTIIMNSRTTAQQLTMTAYIDPKTQKPVQGDGPLVKAAKAGVPLYVDEIMLASPDALTPLYSAMDGRGWLYGASPDGSDVEIQPGFCVIASSNPLVRGAFLPDAIASRFRILNVETSEELMIALGIDATLRTIWKNIRQDQTSWYPSVRTLLAAQEEYARAERDESTMHQVWAALTGIQIPAKDRERVSGIVAKMLGVRVPAGDYTTGLSIR